MILPLFWKLNKYLLGIFLPLLAAWVLLTMRVQTRTDFALDTQLYSVQQIWGGNLEQPMPSIRYKGFGADVATLNKGDIHASDISLDIEMDYRKKGLVYYTGYHAVFHGTYQVQNPEDDKVYFSFIFPYPTKQGEGVLQDVKLLVNGEEDEENTEYQQQLVVWTGLLEAKERREFNVHYKGRGLNHYMYGFEPGVQVNNFKMAIEVVGTDQTDYPLSTMSPTNIEKSDRGTLLTWELDRSLTQFNIGVILPDKLNVAQQIAVMSRRAPVFFVLFLVSLLLILRLSGQAVHFVKIAIICAAYFFFYPLFAYLSVYMHFMLSFLLSFCILGALIFNYSNVNYSSKIAGAICLAYTFYLGVTSLSALFPAYTGLILVLEGVVLLAVVMQVLSRYRHIKIPELFGIPEKQEAVAPPETSEHDEDLLPEILEAEAEQDEQTEGSGEL